MRDESSHDLVSLPDDQARPGARTYAAFVSYAREADAGLAELLRYEIQRFARPWYRRQARRVFLDQASLGASALRPALREALDRSGFLILCVSPEARLSRWVREEVEYWQSTKPPGRVLFIVTKAADGTAHPLSLSELTALTPEALSDELQRDEPRYVDLRWSEGGRPDRNDPRLRDAIADLVAALDGMSKDDLVGEDIRQHRRQRTVLSLGVVALALALVMATGLAVLAREAQTSAETRRLAAVAAQASALSGVELAGDAALGARLALKSYEVSGGSGVGVAALRSVVAQSRLRRTFETGDPTVTAMALDHSGRRLVTIGAGVLRLWSLPSGRPLAARRMPPYAVRYIEFSPSGGTIATGGDDGVARLWGGKNLAPGPVLAYHVRPIAGLAFVNEGQGLVTSGDDGRTARWSLDGRRLWSQPPPPWRGTGDPIVALSRDGEWLAIGDSSSGRVELDSVRGSERRDVGTSRGTLGTLSFGPTRDTLIGSDGTLWTTRSKTKPLHFGDFSKVEHVASASAGDVFALRTENRVEVRSLATGAIRDVVGTGETTSTADPIAIGDDGQTLAASNGDGSVGIWRLGAPPVGREFKIEAARTADWTADAATGLGLRPIRHAVEVYALGGAQSVGRLPVSATQVTMRPNHPEAAIATADGVELWNLQTLKRTRSWGAAAGAKVLFDAGGESMAIVEAAQGRIRLGRVASRPLHVLSPGGYTLGAALGQTGASLATFVQVGTGGNCVLETWSVETGQPSRAGVRFRGGCYSSPQPRCAPANYGLDAVAYDDNEQRVVAAFGSGVVWQVWLRSRRPASSFPVQGRVSDISPGGDFIAACDLRGGRVFPFALPRRAVSFRYGTSAARFAADGGSLATFPASGGPDTLSVTSQDGQRNLGTVAALRRLPARYAFARASAGGREVVTVVREGDTFSPTETVVRWNVETGRVIVASQLEGQAVLDAAYQGRRILLSEQNDAVIRDDPAGAELGRFRDHPAALDSGTLQLAAGSLDRRGMHALGIWFDPSRPLGQSSYLARGLNLETGTEATYGFFGSSALALSPDGESVAGVRARRIQVMATSDGHMRWSTPVPFDDGVLDGVVFSETTPDLFVWAGRDYAVFRVGRGLTIRGRLGPAEKVIGASRDGEVVIARRRNRQTALWDRTGRSRLLVLPASDSDVVFLASSGRRRVLAAGRIQTCRACGPIPEVLRAVQDAAGRQLNSSELRRAGIDAG